MTLLSLERMSRTGRAWSVDLQVEPRDCWIGVFWDRHPREWQVWICLIPCLPIRIEVAW